MQTKLLEQVVRRAREKGLSKGDLAKRAGITAPALSRLLTGQNGARWETVKRLAGAVGLRLELVPDDDFAADLFTGNILDLGDGPN